MPAINLTPQGFQHQKEDCDRGGKQRFIFSGVCREELQTEVSCQGRKYSENFSDWGRVSWGR